MREGRRKKKGPKKGKEFIDYAEEFFARFLSLGIWHGIEAIRRGEIPEELRPATLDRITAFDERFPYQELWRQEWQRAIGDRLWTFAPPDLLKATEEMVDAALKAEEAERKARGDGSLYDEDDYLAFVDHEIRYLFQHREDEFLQPYMLGQSPEGL
ncbi:MAG: hypothetical protein U1B94_04265 [candidate division NC10 bacterium]|jgi:hypothetical protein|nr:hypothetical protein [candidate division NC10 bacterium]